MQYHFVNELYTALIYRLIDKYYPYCNERIIKNNLSYREKTPSTRLDGYWLLTASIWNRRQAPPRYTSQYMPHGNPSQCIRSVYQASPNSGSPVRFPAGLSNSHTPNNHIDLLQSESPPSILERQDGKIDLLIRHAVSTAVMLLWCLYYIISYHKLFMTSTPVALVTPHSKLFY